MTDKTNIRSDADQNSPSDEAGTGSENVVPAAQSDGPTQKEVGGRKGPEPTRYGDWEKNGIISDF